MKITGPGPLAPSVVRPGRRARGNTGASFAGEIAEETPPTGQVAAGAPLSAVEGLLSVQEVDDPTAGRTRALAYGHDLLERYEENPPRAVVRRHSPPSSAGAATQDAAEKGRGCRPAAG